MPVSNYESDEDVMDGYIAAMTKLGKKIEGIRVGKKVFDNYSRRFDDGMDPHYRGYKLIRPN